MNPSKSSVLALAVFGTVMCAACAADAQDSLSRKQKQEAVRAIAEAYELGYVFLDMERQWQISFGVKWKRVNTTRSRGPRAGQRITADLQALCEDRHVVVAYTPERILRQKSTDPRVLAEEELESSRSDNFGFKELRIMSGNVGYLKISSFAGSPEALAVAAAAMRFLSNCDAIIMDLRFNPGGDSAMVQFLASYFLSEEPVCSTNFITAGTTGSDSFGACRMSRGRSPFRRIYIF